MGFALSLPTGRGAVGGAFGCFVGWFVEMRSVEVMVTKDCAS